jgi:protein SCO1
MTSPRAVDDRRAVAWVVLAFGLMLGSGACSGTRGPEPPDGRPEIESEPLPIGGDFVLTSHRGEPFDLKEARGKVVLLFFGFTLCPDVCPTTLATLARASELLGDDRSRMMPVFVSVDPDRDSAERLQEYLEFFGLGRQGVAATGTAQEVDRVVNQYAAFYEFEQSSSEAGYLVNHTTTLYLVDQRGRVRHLFRYGDSAARIADGVRQVLAERQES